MTKAKEATTDPTALDVAQWMRRKLQKHGALYQEDTVYEIARRFGEQFTYTNQSGNLAIGRDVLKEFRRLTEPQVVWVRAERYWRWREGFDPDSGRVAD